MPRTLYVELLIIDYVKLLIITMDSKWSIHGKQWSTVYIDVTRLEMVQKFAVRFIYGL